MNDRLRVKRLIELGLIAEAEARAEHVSSIIRAATIGLTDIETVTHLGVMSEEQVRQWVHETIKPGTILAEFNAKELSNVLYAKGFTKCACQIAAELLKDTGKIKPEDWTVLAIARGEDLTTITFLRDKFPISQCYKCRHHHGKYYNGVEFVCAMHPYGFDGKCPDREERSTLSV